MRNTLQLLPSGFPAPSDSRPSTKPVVCHVVHSLNIGGAEVLAARIAEKLQSDFDPVFACLDDEGPLAAQLRSSGYPVAHLQRRSGFDTGCARRLAKWFAQQRVSLVHAHQYTPFLYTMLAGVSRRRPPLLFTEHGRFHPDRPSWKRQLLTKLLLRRDDQLVGVGNAVRQALIDVERIRGSRVGVVYNGVPIHRDFDQEVTRRSVRREMQVADDTFVVIQVARLDPIKDHGLAIQALRSLVQVHPRSQLWIVGDGPEKTKIEAAIASAGVETHVKLLGQRRDVPALLAAADGCLLTSMSEGIPLVLIEAMAAGRPIVATDVGGVSELVAHGEQGLLCAHGDSTGLAAHLHALAQSKELRKQLGRAGEQQATLFSEERMLAQYRDRYISILGQG